MAQIEHGLGLTRVDWWVAGEEEDGGSGTVFDGVVAPEVLEVDGDAYRVRWCSAGACAWSLVLAVDSCGVSGRTEQFWAPAARESVILLVDCMKMDGGGLRRSARNRKERNTKRWRRLLSGSSI
jgi:hypothetical protein